MPRRVLLVAVLFAACEPALAPPPVRPASPGPTLVRVATWNVHDLFDADDRLWPPGDRDDVPSTAEVEAKLARVAAVLVRLDADVAVLQEVENRAVLDRLAALAGYPVARLVEGLDPRGIDVAALSRLPVAGYVSHLGEVGQGGRPLWPRDCVEVHLVAGGRTLVVVASHLSSALSDDGTRRAEQAAAMRAIADRLAADDPSAVVLAGGDLNDVPDAPALAPLLGDGAWVDVAAEGGTTWGTGTAALRLDYLLVERAHAAEVVWSSVVAGDDVSAASDHRPVAVELLLP